MPTAFRRVAVVGGNGHLGRRIVHRLAADGHVVTVVGRRPPPERAEGVAFVPADARDLAAVERALEGQEVVVDNVSAFRAGGFPRPEHEAIAAHAHPTLVAAARAAGVERALLVSVLAADAADARVPHFHEKQRAEAAWRESGLRIAILRPGMFLDPEDGRIEAGLAKGRFETIGRVDVPFGVVRTSSVLDEVSRVLAEDAFHGGTLDVVESNATAEALAARFTRELGRPIAARALPYGVFSALTAVPRLFSPGLRNLHAMMGLLASGRFVSADAPTERGGADAGGETKEAAAVPSRR